MSTVKDEIQKAEATAFTMTAEAERLRRLGELYPDLQKHTGRWGKVAYYSRSVNALVTDYESRFNCGCCNDSPYEVWPYLETPHGRVYADPPMFFLGTRGDETYVDPHPDWESRLASQGIAQAVIDKLRPILTIHPEEPDEGETEP